MGFSFKKAFTPPKAIKKLATKVTPKVVQKAVASVKQGNIKGVALMAATGGMGGLLAAGAVKLGKTGPVKSIIKKLR